MKRLILSTFLILVLFAGACAPATTPTAAPTPEPAATATTGPKSFPDGLGGEFTLANTPERIVSLAPSTTEILFAIGAGKQVAAREDFTNYPEEAAALPSVGGMSGPVSVEQIVAQEPDLVLAAEISPEELIKGLQDLKIPVMRLSNPRTLTEMYDLLQTAGQLTGHEQEALDLVASLSKREARINEIVVKAESNPVVFYELDGTDPGKPWTAGPGSFLEMLIQQAGGKNAAAELNGEWAQMSVEELLVVDPDIILLGDSNFGTTPEQVAEREGWDALKAVKEGKVFPIDDDLISRPGPRWLDGLEELVKLLHPELADQLK